MKVWCDAMSVEDYLLQNFSHVEETENGWFGYSGSGDYNAVYVPKNYNGAMGMVSYYPGAGGSAPDADQWKNIINSNNPPEYIITISAESRDNANMLATTYDNLTSAGIKITDVVAMTFSASGGTGYDRVEQFLSNHSDVNCTIINNNTGSDGNRYNNPQNYPHLIDAGVPIIYVDPYNSGTVSNKVLAANKNGFNCYYLESSSGGHVAYNADIIHNRFVDYILGLEDSFTSTNTKGNAINYNLIGFNKELGQLTNCDYIDLVNSSVSKVGVPNLAKLTAVDPFDVKESSRLTDDMGVLGNLFDLTLTSSTGKVSNDIYYVQTAMNEIRSMVKSSNYLSSLKEGSYRSADGIPGIINKIMNTFFDAVSELLTSLSIEAESVLSYAQATVDMDNDLKSGAEELGKIEEIPFGDDYRPLSTYKPSNSPYDKSDDEESGKDKDSGKQNTGSPVGGHPVGGTPDGGKPESTEPEEYTYVFDDGHMAVFKTDGKTVTEFKYRYECASAEAAKAKYNDVEKTYRSVDYVDKIEVVDKFVDVIFKAEALKDLTLDQVKEKYLKGAKEKNG